MIVARYLKNFESYYQDTYVLIKIISDYLVKSENKTFLKFIKTRLPKLAFLCEKRRIGKNSQTQDKVS